MAAINGKKIVALVRYANTNGASGASTTTFTTWEHLHEFIENGAERYGYVYIYTGTRDGVAVFTEQHRHNLEK